MRIEVTLFTDETNEVAVFKASNFDGYYMRDKDDKIITVYLPKDFHPKMKKTKTGGEYFLINLDYLKLCHSRKTGRNYLKIDFGGTNND